MTPSQHSKLLRNQLAKLPCFLTSKRSSTNLQRYSLSLTHHSVTFVPSPWHRNRTRELQFMLTPSLRHHSVTRAFLSLSDTIKHNLNIVISRLTCN